MGLVLWFAVREEMETGVLNKRFEALCVSGDQCGVICVAACALWIVGRCGGLL